MEPAQLIGIIALLQIGVRRRARFAAEMATVFKIHRIALLRMAARKMPLPSVKTAIVQQLAQHAHCWPMVAQRMNLTNAKMGAAPSMTGCVPLRLGAHSQYPTSAQIRFRVY